MATRQEIQTGHDLIIFISRINDSLFAMATQLQGIIKMRTSDWLTPARDLTFAELKTSVLDNAQNVNEKYVDWIEAFLLAAPTDLVSNGLSHFTVPRSAIDNDIIADKAHRLSLATGASTSNTTQELKVLGENLESAFNFSLNVDMKTIKMPKSEKITNGCNDCLDTASYELLNINPYTGITMAWTVEEIKARVPDRFRVVELCSTGVSLGSDMPNMLTVATQAKKDLDKASTYQHLSDIADLINTNIPKLPLVRRPWGI